MPIQVTFQLDNSRERADMAKYINAIETSQRPSDTKKNRRLDEEQVVDDQVSAKLKELEEDKKQLQDEIKRHQQNNVKNEEIINNLQKELDALRDENEIKNKEAEESKKLFDEACEETKKVKAEYELKLQQKDDEHQRKIKNIIDFRDKEDQKLHERIDELQKQLESWNPSIVMDNNSEQMYYTVEGDTLVRTNNDAALYSAFSVGDNLYKFQFNWKKGPIRDAFQNKEKDLLPFCEILEGGELESVGRLAPIELGQAVMQSDCLKVINKAKVKLFRD